MTHQVPNPQNAHEVDQSNSVDAQLEARIYDAMAQLDESMDVIPPHINHIQRMVATHQRFSKMRLIRSLIGFWAVAICVLLLLGLLLYRTPNGFIELQIVATLLTFVLGWRKRKRVVEDQ